MKLLDVLSKHPFVLILQPLLDKHLLMSNIRPPIPTVTVGIGDQTFFWYFVLGNKLFSHFTEIKESFIFWQPIENIDFTCEASTKVKSTKTKSWLKFTSFVKVCAKCFQTHDSHFFNPLLSTAQRWIMSRFARLKSKKFRDNQKFYYR